MSEREAKNLKRGNNLEKRTFDFAVEVIKFSRHLKGTKESDIIRYQLSKAATSIGANYEEAQGAYSKSDFSYKIGICLREAKESNYWLRIIKATHIFYGDKLEYLLRESAELKNIFGSMIKKIHYRSDF